MARAEYRIPHEVVPHDDGLPYQVTGPWIQDGHIQNSRRLIEDDRCGETQ